MGVIMEWSTSIKQGICKDIKCLHASANLYMLFDVKYLCVQVLKVLFSVVGIYVCKKNFAIQSAGILILCYNCL